MRYKIILSYNGSVFSGWQSQIGAATVQETLEKALSLLLGAKIAVTGAGRTDSKVNAVGYVAHFDVPEGREIAPTDIKTGQFRYKLNAILPSSVVVHEVSEAATDFHARFDAKSREYVYFLHRRKDPFMEGRSLLWTFPLDVDAMNSAAKCLLGVHDFAAFQKTGSDNKTSVCNVTKAVWAPYVPDHVRILGYPGDAGEDSAGLAGNQPFPDHAEDPWGDYLYFTITADRFLRNMVRAVVGTLLEIGRGKKPVEWAEEVLNSKSRSAAGESVPGYPLFLTKVKY